MEPSASGQMELTPGLGIPIVWMSQEHLISPCNLPHLLSTLENGLKDSIAQLQVQDPLKELGYVRNGTELPQT